MIKDINPHKLSKSSVSKLTYPEVIIHAGTNNIITDSSKECFDNIQLLSSRIKSTFKEARIAISSLITREDIDVTLKTQKTNELLKDLCSKEGYTYIENGNIDATCLNGSKLHLNAKGSALLAVHFIKFIRGTSSRSSAGGFPKELRQLGELLRMIMPQTSKKRTHR
ncbi:Scavenger receptor cysteine-rich type 1 M130 [Paramuricea clavata]|uniref:Scavenger receptor cysteine-rich type 1 M130 n=1 Tax=Paramuricea clavata TaxID=317549 RepID=A0A6S7IJB8_PARCT|nr:Scavenger receptor cysteine-rich type 1 M130 [Paramuricea clavata]